MDTGTVNLVNQDQEILFKQFTEKVIEELSSKKSNSKNLAPLKFNLGLSRR
jgi:hypothetical protein